MGHDSFHAAVSEHGNRNLVRSALRENLCKLVINRRLREPWPESLMLADIDAVLELWFDEPGNVAAFYTHAEYPDAEGRG